MLNEVKDALNEYHNYRLNKSVMTAIVPFILIACIVAASIIIVPLYKNLRQVQDDKEYLLAEVTKLTDQNNTLGHYNQEVVAKNNALKDSIVKKEIAYQNLHNQKDGLQNSLNAISKENKILTVELQKYKEQNQILSIQVSSKDELIEQLRTDSAVLVNHNEEMEFNINQQGHLIYKLRTENTQLLGIFDNLQSKLTFYALLYTPADKPLPAPIFMNLKSEDFQSTFNKQVEEPSVDPARVNISPRKVQKSERSNMGLFIALLSGGGTALLMFIILYARKRHNNSDYRLAC